MIVLAASITAKWYLNEPGSEEASALIRIEVAGAVPRCYREGLIAYERAAEACGLCEADLALGIVRLIPDEDLLPEARAFAHDHPRRARGLPVPLGRLGQPGARVATADRPFHRRAAPAYSIIDLLAAELQQ